MNVSYLKRLSILTLILGSAVLHYGCGSPTTIPMPVPVPAGPNGVGQVPVPSCIPLDVNPIDQRFYFPTQGMTGFVLTPRNVSSFVSTSVQGRLFNASSTGGNKIKVDSNSFGEFILGAQTKSYIVNASPKACVNQIAFNFTRGPGASSVVLYVTTPAKAGVPIEVYF